MRINMNLRVPTYKESPFFTLSEINNSEIFLQICAFLSIYPLNAVKCFHRKGRASGHCKDTAWWREALGSAGWLPLPHYWGFKHLCTHVCLLLWSPVELFCSRAVWEEWPGPIFAKGFQKIAKVRAVLAWLVSSQFSWVWAGQKGSTGAAHGALMSFFIWGSTIQRCFCKFHSMADGRTAPSKAYILHHPMDIRIMESWNHSRWKRPLRAPSPAPDHPSMPTVHVLQCHTSTALEQLHGRNVTSFLGSLLQYSIWEEFLPTIQTKLWQFLPYGSWGSEGSNIKDILKHLNSFPIVHPNNIIF